MKSSNMVRLLCAAANDGESNQLQHVSTRFLGTECVHFRVTRVNVCRCLLFAIVCPISTRITANWRIFLFAPKF